MQLWLGRCIDAEKPSNLYKLSGSEQTIECSNEECKKNVEDDVRQFQNLGAYKPTTFGQMDFSDKLSGPRVTQKILKQGENRGAMDFGKIPEEAKSSG